MKKYRELLSVCFIFFYGLSPLKSMGYTNVVNKNETRFKSHFDNRPLFPSDSLSAQKDKSQGWEILFDGKNTDQWKSKSSETFPSDGWIIKNDSLFLNKKGGGDIITRKKFSDFELDLDFNLTYTANSGIKYFVSKLKNSKTGDVVINDPEDQIIEDYNPSEVKNHKHDTTATASCYLLYTPKNVKNKKYINQ